MKKVFFLLITMPFVLSGCETLDHWLFNASDYHLIESKSDEDDNTIYWDDFDYDIWEEDLEYD